VTVVPVPAAAPAATGNTNVDVNRHLSSSSSVSTDTSSASDGFDLRGAGAASSAVVRGGKGSAYVVRGQYVPEIHTAKRGDTLWGISSRYFGNAYNWPRLWSLNRQVQNPHWIYPGDHIRLRGNAVKQVGFGVGLSKLAPVVSKDTRFQRHLGFILEGRHPTWGEIVGSPDEQMLLSAQDEVYVRLNGKRKYRVGQELLIFEPRKVENLSGAPVVWIRGVLRINRYNSKTNMARARITESLKVIERGAKVGPLRKRVDVVSPKPNKKNLQGRIVASLWPHEFYGQHQVVFINRGSKDGVEAGNRFFAVWRGDRWRRGLKRAGNLADARAVTEDDRMARVEKTPKNGMPKMYPAETYGELLVLRVRAHSSTALVTSALREIPRGATVFARKGY
jgi:hypothetical protein